MGHILQVGGGVAAWPQLWVDAGFTKNLTLLELFPLVVVVEIWDLLLYNKSVQFHSDNMVVVSSVNTLSASSPAIVTLLKQFVLFCLHFNMLLKQFMFWGCLLTSILFLRLHFRALM